MSVSDEERKHRAAKKAAAAETVKAATVSAESEVVAEAVRHTTTLESKKAAAAAAVKAATDSTESEVVAEAVRHTATLEGKKVAAVEAMKALSESGRADFLRQIQRSVEEVDSEHGKLLRQIKKILDVAKAWGGSLAENAEWALGKRTARVLGVVTLFAVVVAFMLVALNWYVAPTKPSDKKDLVLALAQILAGTALLSGLYFTWRTLQVNREGQITDRFTRAIDQLGKTDDEGNKQYEIRLGGIYALERIARESEEDYWPIMEVLTAYVRQRAGEEDRAEEGSSGKESEDPDILAITNVLRRRTRSLGYGEPEPLNLYGANLRGVNLNAANLLGANLSRSNLRNAALSEANLSSIPSSVLPKSARTAVVWLAMLMDANLSGANLRKADLHGAILSRSNLREADLSEANLEGAYLDGADLKGADLKGANLWRANLTQAQLEETRGDEYTHLSSDLKSPAHWGVKTDEEAEEN